MTINYITNSTYNSVGTQSCVPSRLEQAFWLADTIANKVNPFGELREHKQALKRLSTRQRRIKAIFKPVIASNQKKIQDLKKLSCPTVEQTKEVEILENSVKRMTQKLAQTAEEISYVRRDAQLEKIKKMGRVANIAVPGGGRILSFGACAAKAAHAAYFTVFGSCDSEVKAAKVQAVTKQIAIEGAKVLAGFALSYAACYAYSYYTGI